MHLQLCRDVRCKGCDVTVLVPQATRKCLHRLSTTLVIASVLHFCQYGLLFVRPTLIRLIYSDYSWISADKRFGID